MNNPKRLYYMLIIFSIVLSVLIGRLAHIQLVDTRSFSKHQVNLVEESVKQRIHSIALDDGRGKMQDRYGELLAEVHEPSVILFPFLKEDEEALEKLSPMVSHSTFELKSKLEGRKDPLVIKNEYITRDTVEHVNDLMIQGAFGQMLSINEENTFATHFIGSVGENPGVLREKYPERIDKGLISISTKTGINGIQAAFDPFLISEGESKLIYHVEQSGKPLFGFDVKYTAPSNPFYPVTLRTTLDPKAQRIVEDAIDQFKITMGGAVLLDVNSSDVLAMASRPLPPHSNPLAEGTANKMLETHFPGSVFKIVTAAAAIEEDHLSTDPDRVFDCSRNTYNEGQEQRDLGNLTFKESFYQSCNNTFATLLNEMMENDKEITDEYAAKLGLTAFSGWTGDVFHFEDFEHYPGEHPNTIWNDEQDKNVSRAIAQTAIGQLNVRVSPLSVANMMATIARGGTKKQVRAAHSVLYKNGTTLADFKEKEIPGDTLSRYSIKELQKLLKGVVSDPNGTGHSSFSQLPWAVAGKSGTAEKGEKGQKVYNKWFAGYFPAYDPKYALVVVDLDAAETETATNKTFAQIVQQLYETQQQPD
ncbi:penicillin-binding protein 2 [Bacillus sp. Marseille-Q3570]|uniref:peptidoglycan D,D-transpeptidase FtsI family protein n=1 Tax=Bacillus sp. Marseille-Q3570 TaxID=2963522 RepID=UPI0021B7E4FD|nr:penicillin-binding transpeptidase domain-containing protein [Bacillus sp. Marseille-Q3570]